MTDSIRRHAASLARRLARRGTYVGAARELAHTAVHAAAYPLGLLPGRPELGSALRPAHARPGSLLASDPATAQTPVVLVHGYVHNRSAFLMMGRALRRAGFQHVHSVDHTPLVNGLPQVARLLAQRVEQLLEATGAPRCMVVGHSMGGVAARSYVQQFGGEHTVELVITLGAPHRGTYASYLGLGPAAAQLRPGSAFLRELEASTRRTSVRYVAFHSDLDITVLPASSARLEHPDLRATNVRVRDTGHLSLLLSGEVLYGVVRKLVSRGAEPDTAPG